jgi:hypothetical protein
MSFSSSAFSFYLEADGHTLAATCEKADGNEETSYLDLNTCLGNKDGSFEWGGTEFSFSASNITLDGTELSADLLNENDELVRDTVNLDDYIANEDGVLKYV